MTIRLRRIIVAPLLGVIALGAATLVGLGNPNAPHEAMLQYLPQITLPAVLVAGVVDGINPCAFTVLLLFITALLSTLEGQDQSLGAVRTRLIGMGSIYIGAVFLTYLALGVGILGSLDLFTRQHLPARIGALFAVLFGLWMLKDFFLPEWGWCLQAPPAIGRIARQSARRATI